MTAADRPVTLPQAFQRTARIGPDAVAVRTVGDTQTLTWRDYAAQVRQVAAGLAALGVGRGDTVSLMMANRIEFYPLEVGAQHVGATSFSVYNGLAAKQLTHVLANAGTKVVFCEEQYVDRIKASDAGIDTIVCIDGYPEGTMSVDDLIACGSADFDFESTWRAVQPDDVATLVYTSGTTGNPKQVETTHASLLSEVFGLDEVLGLRYGDRVTSFLPNRAHRGPTERSLCPGGDRHPGDRRRGYRDDRHRVARGEADLLGRHAAGVGKAEDRNRSQCRGRDRRKTRTKPAYLDRYW
jgi:long-subunit acyl-CoA synthetase (AMP-forming)